MSQTENVSFNRVYLEKIARVCHDANRAYCISIGDDSQKPWEEADHWQTESAVKGVAFRINNPRAMVSAQHESWMEEKVKDGWVWGEVKDADKKTHPCLVPYDKLPENQRRKDALFVAIVDALK